MTAKNHDSVNVQIITMNPCILAQTLTSTYTTGVVIVLLILQLRVNYKPTL